MAVFVSCGPDASEPSLADTKKSNSGKTESRVVNNMSNCDVRNGISLVTGTLDELYSDSRHCLIIISVSAGLRCSRCHKAYYCGPEHQAQVSSSTMRPKCFPESSSSPVVR